MDVTFREAIRNDFGEIEALSKGIYNNTDTIVTDFIEWFNSDKWFQFVGETQQGAVIAFIAIHVTDGKESLNIRSSRVSEDYRGRGIYKALFSYAVKYVRERLSDVKRIYRLRPADIKVPYGYEIIKKRHLVKVFLNCDVKVDNKEADQCKVEFITWPKFKELYEDNDTVKRLFVGNTLEIYGDIFLLSCKENWKILEERVNVRIMITEYIGEDGFAETVISFLRLEKSFTNIGRPMVPVNIYGVHNKAAKCHISKAVLEARKYIGSGQILFAFFVEKTVILDFIAVLKELADSDVEFHEELNLLRGDLSRNLGDL